MRTLIDLSLGQDPDAVVDLSSEAPEVRAEAGSRSAAAFQAVISDAANIQFDHYLLYYTRKLGTHGYLIGGLIQFSDYELGRLLACQGDKESARRHLELVMSGECKLALVSFLLSS